MSSQPNPTSRPDAASAASAASNDPVVKIDSLDMEARGVGRLENEDGTPGKVIFVEGALPGETVAYRSYRR
ncbi:MAG TPA: 23S rRNA (uracil(1939)-C(5))-methyltransferase, partial [Cupriavidus sp.]|nr:23S rRNA (uracil(1939)-C(5))-methyltransferase [Cupriavidus sp.]